MLLMFMKLSLCQGQNNFLITLVSFIIPSSRLYVMYAMSATIENGLNKWYSRLAVYHSNNTRHVFPIGFIGW